ncbi:hypothetical protein B296_00036028 [Ensete ventricosum]|uniref:Piwi domain-containing protein n=1 Tax=Ensete ventricosum TaxID=4639 RepID=A0A426YP72_ENSVE|nr:hypothetical protein B296_00036028 [Ensete ventricosum]
MFGARPDQVERALKSCYNDAMNILQPLGKELDLLIVILPDNNGPLYGITKKLHTVYPLLVSNCHLCRDGVSEGQFYQVLLHELDAIRKLLSGNCVNVDGDGGGCYDIYDEDDGHLATNPLGRFQPRPLSLCICVSIDIDAEQHRSAFASAPTQMQSNERVTRQEVLSELMQQQEERQELWRPQLQVEVGIRPTGQRCCSPPQGECCRPYCPLPHITLHLH